MKREARGNEARRQQGDPSREVIFQAHSLVELAGDQIGDDGLVDIVVMPDGYVHSDGGDFVVDAEAWRLMAAAFEDREADPVIDYHHQSLGGEYAAPDGKAPAAGWIRKLRYEPGRGVVAAVWWTEKARQMIRAGEYRYLSPVNFVRKSDKRSIELHSAGLTNEPAIRENVPKLAAERTLEKEKKVMADEPAPTGDIGMLIGQILAKLDITDLENVNDVPAALKAILEAVAKKGGGETEGEGESEEVASSIRAALKLSDKADVETVVAAIDGLRQGSGTVTALQKQVNELQTGLAERDANDLLKPFIAKGVLHPEGNEEDKDFYKRMSSEAKKDPENCKVILARFVKVLPPEGKTAAPEGAGPKGNDRAGIIADEVRIFNSTPTHLTDLATSVNQRLLDAKQAPLVDDERQKLVVG